MTWLRVGLLYGSTSNITATKSEIRQRLVKSMHLRRKKNLKLLYRVLTLRFFSPEIHALVFEFFAPKMHL